MRFLPVALVAALGGSSLLFALGDAATATPPTGAAAIAARDDEVLRKLDEISRRLEKIESRLEQVPVVHDESPVPPFGRRIAAQEAARNARTGTGDSPTPAALAQPDPQPSSSPQPMAVRGGTKERMIAPEKADFKPLDLEAEDTANEQLMKEIREKSKARLEAQQKEIAGRRDAIGQDLAAAGTAKNQIEEKITDEKSPAKIKLYRSQIERINQSIDELKTERNSLPGVPAGSAGASGR